MEALKEALKKVEEGEVSYEGFGRWFYRNAGRIVRAILLLVEPEHRGIVAEIIYRGGRIIEQAIKEG